ncbi:MAG TPA: hypothetical protein EYP63_00020 [Desulfotomaculum sp.]|nr:hypothetical protein [Desulfotomaculum sp.]
MVDKLSLTDLNFIIETVATKRRDYDNIREIVWDKPDLLDIMLDDPKLFQRVMNEEEVFVRISPYLFFEVLLRQAKRELKAQRYTYEKAAFSATIPVFDAPQAGELLAQGKVRRYLAGMLASFTRTHSATVYYRVRGRLYSKRYSDLSVDDLQDLAQLVDEEYRFPLYRRIGDLCLFLTSIYPEYIEQELRYPFTKARRPAFFSRKSRDIDDYIEEGSRFYRMASEDRRPAQAETNSVLRTLADSFFLARKPLMHIADRYLCFKKFDLFS